jgi:hypothetical protein
MTLLGLFKLVMLIMAISAAVDWSRHKRAGETWEGATAETIRDARRVIDPTARGVRSGTRKAADKARQWNDSTTDALLEVRDRYTGGPPIRPRGDRPEGASPNIFDRARRRWAAFRGHDTTADNAADDTPQVVQGEVIDSRPATEKGPSMTDTQAPPVEHHAYVKWLRDQGQDGLADQAEAAKLATDEQRARDAARAQRADQSESTSGSPQYTPPPPSANGGNGSTSTRQSTFPGGGAHSLVDFATAVKHLASGPYNGLRDIELRMRAMGEGIGAMGEGFKLMARYLQEIQIEMAAVDKTSQLGDLEKSAAAQAEELANLFHVIYQDIMRHREKGLRVPDHNTVNRGL